MRRFFSSVLFISAVLLLTTTTTTAPCEAQPQPQSQQQLLRPWTEPSTIVVGSTPAPGTGWMEGICYAPISNVTVGDVIQFDFTGAHNVYKMATQQHFETCNFQDAILLAELGQGQLKYKISEQDAMQGGSIYFACQIGAHCQYQKLRVNVELNPSVGNRLVDSRYIVGASPAACAHNGDTTLLEDQSNINNVMESECSDPVWQVDGTYYVTCLSGPNTLTPGGVINQARILQYPYPTDRRVKVGLRTWEFVADGPNGGDGAVLPVPINQLYVHHLSGRVILGQGTEGIRQSHPDAPFPHPYGMVTGDEGDMMVFHIIDLREVDDWLACIECRCKDGNGTYLDGASNTNQKAVSVTGGVDCCTNCTSLVGPTVDYRMRYNVSYWEIEEDDEPTSEILMLTADISPAVGKNIEFDVPQYESLPFDQIAPNRPFVQRLVREGPFNELFKMEFFGDDYSGPDTVKLFRCVGHLHVAAIGMWVEDATTNETLCKGIGRYGEDPLEDKGFLNAISVDSFERPKTFPADLPIRLVSEYDATELHTGVMGMWFAFISAENQVTASEAALTIDVCTNPTCDASLLPSLQDISTEAPPCVDALPVSPICRFANICECEDFVNAPESSGCNGVYSSSMGDVPINSMCKKYCGCPSPDAEAPGATTSTCVDTLKDHPLCKFGSLCECNALVASPDSTGCGGAFTSQMGDVQINDVCAQHCDACPDTTISSAEEENERIEQALVDLIETELVEECHYATASCRSLLSNLYSCAEILEKGKAVEMVDNIEDGDVTALKQQLMVPPLDSAVESVAIKHGRRLALQYAKLGHPSLHAQEEEAIVGPCVEDNNDGNSTTTATGNSAAASVSVKNTAFSVFVLAFVLLQF